ncbi:MAG: alkyl hydroperoxide reductase [Anaerolineae bacterium]
MTTNPDSILWRYRPWFFAQAFYNLIWGAVNILFPRFYFDLIGMPPPNYPALWQVVGMFVLVYVPAYWWAARAPYKHRHLVLIAALGKVLGPIGFAWAALTGQLPIAFGLTLLTNDLIWWPALALYLYDVSRLCGGVRALFVGD